MDPQRIRVAALLWMVAAVCIVAHAEISAQKSLYTGKIGGRITDVLIVETGNGVLGATIHPKYERPHWTWHHPAPGVRLLTGTRKGTHVTLTEWKTRGTPSATIVAEVSDQALTGTWQESGRAPTAFRLEHDKYPSPLVNTSLTAYPVLDRLHDDIRNERWDDAAFEAKLVSVLPGEQNGWPEAIEALREGRDPPATKGAPWAGLILERSGDRAGALETDERLCRYGVHSGCNFMLDLVASQDRKARREALWDACKYSLVGCEEYWGKNEVDLIDAASEGDVDRVEDLLRQKTRVNGGGKLLGTPLEAAVESGSVETVKLLLDHGADPNSGATFEMPLEMAVDGNKDEITRLLLDHGAKAGLTRNVLVTLAAGDKRDLVMKILENGEPADTNADWNGSALIVAVDNGDAKLVEALMNHGADPNFFAKFTDGSAIDHAERAGRKDILKLLEARRHVIKPDSQDQ